MAKRKKKNTNPPGFDCFALLSYNEDTMITRTYECENNCSKQLTIAGIPEDKCLFFDIETTGFLPARSCLYLIGAAVRHADKWLIKQWLIEDRREEQMLLSVFAQFIRPFSHMIHFNGDRFDIPYLKEKYLSAGLDDPFTGRTSFDLLKEYRPLKKLLGLSSLNQRSFERFLDMNREDKYDGGLLIPVFRDFAKDKDPDKAALLLLHNKEDVEGLTALMSVYGYKVLSAERSVINGIKRINGGSGMILTAALPLSLPVPVSRQFENARISLEGSAVSLVVPVVSETMLHFFSNWKDYYYLPLEDQAVHKSVAAYVSKERKVRATKDTCYIRQSGTFIPAPPFADGRKDMYFEVPGSDIRLPVMKRRFDDSVSWLPCPDTEDAGAFFEYYLHSFMKSL